MKIGFSLAALKSARDQINYWGYKGRTSSVRFRSSMECDFYNEIGPLCTNYGVEDAIKAGKRVRLLHQIKGERRMNCCETGINMFLLYCACGQSRRTRLMRYQDAGPSDHFGVVRFDLGLKRPPIINDPLSNRLGRVKFVSDGFIYYPISLTSQGRLIPGLANEIDNHDLVDEIQHVKTKILLLDENDVVRHVNFLNSPLGFFAYFQKGQKLREENFDIIEAEYHAQTIEDKLSINVACKDPLLDLFTFNRTYSVQDGNLRWTDSCTIHTELRWTSPLSIVYQGGMGDHKEHLWTTPLGESKEASQKEITKTKIALIEYLRRLQASGGTVYSKKEHEATISSWKKQQKDAIETVQKRTAEVNQMISVLENRTRIELLPSEEIFEDVHKAIDTSGSIDHLLDYMDSLQTTQRELFIDQMTFIDRFHNRAVRISRPYGKPAKDSSQFLKEYCAIRHRYFKDTIDKFMDSPVLKSLISQYKGALEIKQAACCQN